MKRIADDVEEVALQTATVFMEIVFQRSLYVKVKDVKERKHAAITNVSNLILMRQTVDHAETSAPVIQNVARVSANLLRVDAEVLLASLQKPAVTMNALT